MNTPKDAQAEQDSASSNGASSKSKPSENNTCKNSLSKIDPGKLERADIKRALIRDQFKLQREWQQANTPEAVNKTQQKLAQSIAKCEQRAANLPKPEYADDLPVVQQREIIKDAINKHQVVVVCGETGSGKTTQLPKICLELGRGSAGRIGHTQPRRLAARSVAMRIAEELNTQIGEHVGFKVRFSDQVSEQSCIKLMTDGILLAETQTDRFFNQYDTLIIDEAHERSLNIDFLLGYLKRLLPKRPDLKIIITSATIDPERFSKHFNDAPIIMVEGRTYPVDVKYRPLVSDDEEDSRALHLQEGIAHCLDEIMKLGTGDVLVFLSGERDIRETADYLSKQHYRHTEILPLYGRLSASDQQKIFSTGKGRRVVLSTNVAETSVTVPGIVYVIDTGLARISRYSYRSKIQRLPIEPISQASANQRKGRCGRVAPGVCFRLYSEEDFEQRDEFTEPEIQRTNLAEVILQMESLRLGHLQDFPLIDAPDPRFVRDGYLLLFELGATDEQDKLTPLGRQMSRLPIDPRLARILIAGKTFHCVNEMLCIASALSIQDPRERPHDMRGKADEQHAQWHDPKSDFVALLNLWIHYQEQKKKLSNNQLRKWCKHNFLSYLRMREWEDVRRQLSEQTKPLGLALNPKPATYDDIHRALLYGMLSHIGQQDEKTEYLGPRNRRFKIFPGSGTKTRPSWLMAAEIFETSQVFAHTIAGVQPQWLEQQAAHLLKRTQFEPYFHRKSGQVSASEKVTLYGLVVNPKKRVNYSEINPVESRQIFIRDALADMQLISRAPFMRHNQRLIADIETLEAKARRRDLLDDLDARIAFFEARVPAEVVNAKTFEAWRKAYERASPHGLFLNRSDCLTQAEFDVEQVQYPDTMNFDGLSLPLSYQFAPNQEDDGVTLHIPAAALNQVNAAKCHWLVPGMLEDKIAALIKALPKNERVKLVPAHTVAKEILETLTPYDGNLHEQLARAFTRLAGIPIHAQSLNEALIDEHHRMRFVVHDTDGKVLGVHRNLGHLQSQLAQAAQTAYENTNPHELERTGIKRWDFQSLPQQVTFEQDGILLKGYPALVDYGDSISIELLDREDEQSVIHKQGLRRLFQLNLRDSIRYLKRNIPDLDAIALWYAPVGSRDELIDDVINAITERVFINHQTLPNNQRDFEQAVANGKSELIEAAAELSTHLVTIFQRFHTVRKRVTGELELNWIEAAEDVLDQLEWLIYDGFLSETPEQWLAYYPRYLTAISERLDKLNASPEKDRLRRAEIQPLWERFKDCWDELPAPQAHETRWAIEELRVSLFAQALGTKLKVSPDRVSNQLDALEKQIQAQQNT